MNKTIIIALAVILLFVVAGGAFLFLNKSKTNLAPATNSLNSGTEVIQETETAGQKSLKDLLQAGVAQKCTFVDNLEETDIRGTTYIASGKVRGDFTTSTEGSTVNGHTIFDGNSSYFWTDEATTGFKMAIDPNTFEANESSAQQGVDLNKAINYSCTPWVVDQSLLNPPLNITFTEISVPKAPTGGSSDSTSGNQDACSYCDALTGDAKTQCLASLNCN